MLLVDASLARACSSCLINEDLITHLIYLPLLGGVVLLV